MKARASAPKEIPPEEAERVDPYGAAQPQDSAPRTPRASRSEPDDDPALPAALSLIHI